MSSWGTEKIIFVTAPINATNTTVDIPTYLTFVMPGNAGVIFEAVLNIETDTPGAGFNITNAYDVFPNSYYENFIVTQNASGVTQAKNNGSPTILSEIGATGAGWAVYLKGAIQADSNNLTWVLNWAQNVAGGTSSIMGGSYLKYTIFLP